MRSRYKYFILTATVAILVMAYAMFGQNQNTTYLRGDGFVDEHGHHIGATSKRKQEAASAKSTPTNTKSSSSGVESTAPAKTFTPTEVQALKLKVTQQEAQLLQAQLQNVQRQFQDKVSQLMQEANKVKLEQGWPPETVFNPDSLVFSAPPPKEEPKK